MYSLVRTEKNEYFVKITKAIENTWKIKKKIVHRGYEISVCIVDSANDKKTLMNRAAELRKPTDLKNSECIRRKNVKENQENKVDIILTDTEVKTPPRVEPLETDDRVQEDDNCPKDLEMTTDENGNCESNANAQCALSSRDEDTEVKTPPRVEPLETDDRVQEDDNCPKDLEMTTDENGNCESNANAQCALSSRDEDTEVKTPPRVEPLETDDRVQEDDNCPKDLEMTTDENGNCESNANAQCALSSRDEDTEVKTPPRVEPLETDDRVQEDDNCPKDLEMTTDENGNCESNANAQCALSSRDEDTEVKTPPRVEPLETDDRVQEDDNCPKDLEMTTDENGNCESNANAQCALSSRDEDTEVKTPPRVEPLETDDRVQEDDNCPKDLEMTTDENGNCESNANAQCALSSRDEDTEVKTPPGVEPLATDDRLQEDDNCPTDLEMTTDENGNCESNENAQCALSSRDEDSQLKTPPLVEPLEEHDRVLKDKNRIITMHDIMNELDDPEMIGPEVENLRNHESYYPLDLSSVIMNDISLTNNNLTGEEEDETAGHQSTDLSEIPLADSTWVGQSSLGENNTDEAETTGLNEISGSSLDADASLPRVAGSINKELLTVKSNSKGTKRNFCCYCKTLQCVISRHLEHVHKDEPEVKQFAMLPAGNPERKKLIEKLRANGNNLYNTNKSFNSSGSLIVARRPKEERSALQYAPCHNCKVQFSLKTIRRHRQACLGHAAKGKRTNVMLSKRVEGQLHPDASGRLIDIFAVFREDDIVRLIRYDELIVRLGNALCEKYRKPQNDEMIRNRLRTLGRLLKTMRELKPEISDLKSIIHPKFYQTLLQAVRKLSGFNEKTGEHAVTSIVTNLGTYIKTAAKLLKLMYVEKVDDENEKLVDKYLFLHGVQYHDAVSRVALEDQAKKHRQQVKPLPTIDDIKKLSAYLEKNRKNAYSTLQQEFSFENWLNLSKYTLISIMVFNRKRAGEIERTAIDDLKSYEQINETDHPEAFGQLTNDQKTMASEYGRFVIVGKLQREVPVLIDTDIKNCIDLLLQYRQRAKIPAGNPYIFGIPGFKGQNFKYLRACVLLRQYANECGAKNPERLRGTYLRKHMATTCAVENINENEIVDIANFMGHHEAIHRSHYRRSVVTRDVIGVAKRLRKAVGYGEQNSEEENEILSSNDDSGVSGSDYEKKIGPSSISRRASKKKSNKTKRPYSTDAETSSSDDDLHRRKTKSLKIPSKAGNPPPKKKNRWTAIEKSLALEAFGDSIRSNKLPATSAIRRFLKKNPSITRTEDQVRAWAWNAKKKWNINESD